MFFKRNQVRQHLDGIAHSLYSEMVKQARLPVFYATMGVADTLDGRFEMLALHVGLLVKRLGTSDLTQALVDLMFADLDTNLRESGVSDLSVGRKVRKMAESFYGRLHAYEEAIIREDKQALTEALERNLYGKVPDKSFASKMADYVFKLDRHLAAQPTQSLSEGRLTLVSP